MDVSATTVPLHPHAEKRGKSEAAKKKSEAAANLSDKKRDRETQKRERAIATDVERKRKRLAQAGVEWDPRTAQGQREFYVVGLGPSNRASIPHFDNCLKRKEDRTNPRRLAWAEFDKLQDAVHSGNIASPKLEPGVDCSAVPDVADQKLMATRKDDELRRWIGGDNHDLLHLVIYRQHTYRDVAGEHGDHRVVSAIFQRALDQVAAFFGHGPSQHWRARRRVGD